MFLRTERAKQLICHNKLARLVMRGMRRLPLKENKLIFFIYVAMLEQALDAYCMISVTILRREKSEKSRNNNNSGCIFIFTLHTVYICVCVNIFAPCYLY